MPKLKKKSIFYLDVIIKRSGKSIIKKRMKKRTGAIMFWVIEEGKKNEKYRTIKIDLVIRDEDINIPKLTGMEWT